MSWGEPVPRFFFNVYDGFAVLDADGTELLGLQEARSKAIEYAGALLKDDSKRLALGEDWRMEVTDERQLVLFRIDFTVMDSPATMAAIKAPAT
jgi:hypothetical protein